MSRDHGYYPEITLLIYSLLTIINNVGRITRKIAHIMIFLNGHIGLQAKLKKKTCFHYCTTRSVSPFKQKLVGLFFFLQRENIFVDKPFLLRYILHLIFIFGFLMAVQMVVGGSI